MAYNMNVQLPLLAVFRYRLPHILPAAVQSESAPYPPSTIRHIIIRLGICSRCNTHPWLSGSMCQLERTHFECKLCFIDCGAEVIQRFGQQTFPNLFLLGVSLDHFK